MESETSQIYRRGRILYILEAALEYLISILVAGSFLATLTGSLGMSDSLTGILSSFISMGCLFQLGSVFLRPRRVKPFVIGMSVLNQVLFLVLFLLPLPSWGAGIKTALFIGAFFVAYVIYNLVFPKKISWLMTSVAEDHRGRFTANKEIFSLITGMIFTYAMGAMIDFFRDRGEIRTAFILCAVTVFALTAGHTVTMLLFSVPAGDGEERVSLKQALSEMLRNRKLLRVTGVFVLYYIAAYLTTPFYGTYQIRELGFSLTFCSVLAIVSSGVRILASPLLGKLGDRRSFAFMLRICFVFYALALICAALATPESGKIFFTLYYVFFGVALGGISSSLLNLVFDCAPQPQRANALALCQSVSGTAGFLATLAASPVMAYVQGAGNRLFGLPVYAQQIFSAAGVLLIIAATALLRPQKRN